MPAKKWAVKRLTISLARQEAEQLEEMQQLTGRSASDIIREAIRLMYEQRQKPKR
ncbi:MAG: CopG family transcriptional regulator [Hapalosiphonaceae cyanobacterium JJU2]|nr:MAG: CopG family transcriptional regulator [Hapalosiphonaceae cyanobacterium JJU2]